MRYTRWLAVAVGLLCLTPSFLCAQAAELAGAPEPEPAPPGAPGPLWSPPAPDVVLWDNGPLVNVAGNACTSGIDTSRLQTGLGMNTLGFGHQVLNNNRVADDFTVPDGGWTVTTATFFAYQTGSGTTSTMTAANYRIWDGDPSVGGSNVVCGDGATNCMTGTAFTGIYRDSETTPGCTRPVMAQTCNLGTCVLAAGTYWIDWQTDGSLASGPWAPPVTINGQTTTGNALQYTSSSGAWGLAQDSGTLTQQAFPFILEGPAACVLDQPNIAVQNDLGECGAVVTFAPSASGSCGTVTCNPPSGSFFPVGTTPVLCSEPGGASVGFDITVNDTEAPQTTCPANMTVNVPPGTVSTPVNFVATVTDNCAGATVDCVPPSGSSFPLGTTAVTCTGMDAVENTSTCGFDVTVQEQQSVIEIPALDATGLGLLGAGLAAAAVALIRRRRKS